MTAALFLALTIFFFGYALNIIMSIDRFYIVHIGDWIAEYMPVIALEGAGLLCASAFWQELTVLGLT